METPNNLKSDSRQVVAHSNQEQFTCLRCKTSSLVKMVNKFLGRIPLFPANKAQ